MGTPLTDAAWENLFAPYDPSTYQAVLEQLLPLDIVLDIGAGDLRLTRAMAKIVYQVYAIEQNPAVLAAGLASGPLPDNLFVLPGDARQMDYPRGITTGVLLMRHCTHFRLYAEKLRQAGATKLLTNARWRMGVESIQLHDSRMNYSEAPAGWYACWCGATGFILGPAEKYTDFMDREIHEVMYCPMCSPVKSGLGANSILNQGEEYL